MQRHKNEVHLKLYAVNCLHCGKTCASRGDLKTHTKIHTNERPHACNSCDRKLRIINLWFIKGFTLVKSRWYALFVRTDFLGQLLWSFISWPTQEKDRMAAQSAKGVSYNPQIWEDIWKKNTRICNNCYVCVTICVVERCKSLSFEMLCDIRI